MILRKDSYIEYKQELPMVILIKLILIMKIFPIGKTSSTTCS